MESKLQLCEYLNSQACCLPTSLLDSLLALAGVLS